MAKIKMSRLAGWPVRSLRRLAGIPAHRPSAFNACIGAALKGKKYAKPAPRQGGQNNPEVRAAFTSAAKSCGR